MRIEFGQNVRILTHVPEVSSWRRVQKFAEIFPAIVAFDSLKQISSQRTVSETGIDS